MVLTTVRATDATPETTGQILYSIASCKFSKQKKIKPKQNFYRLLIDNLFSVIPPNSDVTFMAGSTSGVITVNGTLDRETLSRYIVQVSVSCLSAHSVD